MKENEELNYQIDNTDKAILKCLMEDAMMPYTEVAKKVFVSPGTVHVRMNKLKEMGVVKGAQLIIDPAKMGYDIGAFIGIFLEKNSLFDEAAKAIKKIPEVVSLYYTTGMYSMFAHIMCRDTQHLRRVLHDKVQKINGVHRTETFISLEETINRAIPLEE